MIDLKKLGWDAFFESQLTPQEKLSSIVARVVEPARGLSRAVYSSGEVWAEQKELHGPAVGDWVVGTLRDAGIGEKRLSIERTLTRKNQLSRSAGNDKGYEQILCANTDIAFVTIALNQALNPNAVTRYLDLVKESGMLCVVVLTKIDTGDAKAITRSLSPLVEGLPFHAISVREGRGLQPLQDYFSESKTIVLLGSSGVGKSTLVNYFTHTEAQGIGEVRESDQKGRHTTSGRRLHQLPSGGMIIDSPGIREIRAWKQPGAAHKPKGKPRPRESARGRWTSEEE
jgi:ribosome biogenesis GTPase